MLEENVSENIVEVAEPQIEETEVNNEQEEVVTPQPQEVNSQFAKVRREAEQKAMDKVIAEIYGGQGIHTYAEYMEAKKTYEMEQQRQEYIDKGIDPDTLNQLIEQHPDIQYARQLKAKEEENAKFDAESAELLNEFPDLDADTIPNEVFQLRKEKGLSLLDAYLRVNYKTMTKQAEQNTIKKLQNNALTTPGALGSGGEVDNPSISKMSKSDFNSLVDKVMRGEIKGF